MMALVCALLLTTMSAGLWRAARGPSPADRLLGLQMLGTTGIALLLALAEWQQQPALRDIAAALALLATSLAAAMVQVLRVGRREGRDS